MTRTFHVVTQRNWMAQELSDALEPEGWRVAQHYGLDALEPHVGHDPDHVLWAPGAFAAREIAWGNPLRLSAPGSGWLPSLTDPFSAVSDSVSTERSIELVSASDALNNPREGFWKLAETKYEKFESTWRTADKLVRDIRTAGLPNTSKLHYTPTRLSIIREYRAVINHGQATTVSCYLDNEGRDRSHPDFVEPAPVLQRTAERLASVTAAEIEKHLPAGPAYTLDIAQTNHDFPVVLEVNPIWSSAWYGCDLVAFAEAVAAGHGDTVPDEFLWHPDDLLVDRARRAGPLPTRSHSIKARPV